MKICFIANGSSNHIWRIANYFVANNHEVHLISYCFRQGYDKRIYQHKLKLIDVPMGKYLGFIFWIDKIKKIIHKVQPDIVNAHFITVYGFLASIVGIKPLILTAWGSDLLLQPKKNIFYKALVKYTTKRANRLICLFNKNILEPEIQKLFPKNLRVESIPQGINTSKFNKQAKDTKLLDSFGIEEGVTIIINPRSLSPVYDPMTFIKGVSTLNKLNTGFKAIMIRKPEQNEYDATIQELNIEDNLLFIDWIPHDKMPEYLSLADIYVSTSLSDGASNALFEAMSCELPCVVTDIPANRCWIKDGKNGLLFKPGDYKELANKIIYLLENENIRKEYGVKCREIVTEHADYTKQMAKMEKVFFEVVKEGR